MTTSFENFDSIAKALIDSAPSKKAYDFACKIANQVADRGQEWIEANASALHIRIHADDQSICPVADNRLWYLAQWQVALSK